MCVKKWKQIFGQKNFLEGNVERTQHLCGGTLYKWTIEKYAVKI